ncbi:hypothetical protein IFM89_012189 [Coptis chinensis]|uniref:QWRF motif-containing protein 2 n=1 Tax=Coptis chinensis TaxID=261450 RepID=A0A835LMS8_9MAGN|nr:hypothetical protein IFM89_012189 [Coptis chinensis]
MVSTITATTSTHSPNTKTQQETRPPLLPSEKDNGFVSKRTKSKEITSRYMSSSSSSKRYPSPSLPSTKSTTTATPLPSVKRSQSVDRSRPITPRPITPLPNSRPGNAAPPQQLSSASKILLSSTRSLSVSFQGESFSLPVSKVKAPTPPSNVRRGTVTPERRKTTPLRGRVGDQVENSKPIDQHRWPGRTRQQQPMDSLTRSLDCTNKVVGSASVSRVFNQSLIDLSRRASFDGRLNPKFGRGEISKTVHLSIGANSSYGSDDVNMSDTESVSSGSNSSSQEYGGIASGRAVPRGISVPARFWQETNSRMRRLQEPGSPLSRTPPSSKVMTPTKFIPLKKTISDVPISSPKNVPMSRTMSSPMRGLSRPASPMRGLSRPASPSRLMVPSTPSPSRGTASPTRMRNVAVGAGSTQFSITPSILSFVANSRSGKMGENRIVDAHHLRLLYNRQLQWRFVNARADASLFLKRLTTEKNLYNAWITTTELHDSITIKKIKLQMLRQNLKLTSILKGQMTYFKEWAVLDREYSSSLSGAVEALEASTLRLPVVSGARADIQNVMDAIGSTVSVMQAMAASLCSLLSKVEEVNMLMDELANATAEERALLVQCRDHLSILSAMQVGLLSHVKSWSSGVFAIADFLCDLLVSVKVH